MEEVLGDITAITGMSAEELPLSGVVMRSSGRLDFESVHAEIYEQDLYPAMEHLNYIDFDPALHRGRFVLEQLPRLDKERGRFLDAGCGPGVLLSLILQAKPEWIGHGIDISASCRDYAAKLVQRKGVDDRARLDVGDIRDLPYDDEEFDLVVAVEVLEHVPDSEVGMRELLRVLNPGGLGILALPVDLPARVHLRDFADVSDVLSFYAQFDMDLVRFECEEFMAGSRPFIDTFALVRKPLK
jgi:SAM-dependent methyltransferase